MTEWAIRVKDLRKRYPGRSGPVHAVNGIDLEIKSGECFGLLGPNGAGKTTTVRRSWKASITPRRARSKSLACTGGPTRPPSASGSESPCRKPDFPIRRRSTRSSLCFAASTRPACRPDDVISRVSLESKSNAFIEQLSGGQQQRLAVAISLVGDPEILFLDEPTTGLDPQSHRQLWEVIRELHDRGRTVLLTTHYMDEAERLCNRVAIIDHGKIHRDRISQRADQPPGGRPYRGIRA